MWRKWRNAWPKRLLEGGRRAFPVRKTLLLGAHQDIPRWRDADVSPYKKALFTGCSGGWASLIHDRIEMGCSPKPSAGDEITESVRMRYPGRGCPVLNPILRCCAQSSTQGVRRYAPQAEHFLVLCALPAWLRPGVRPASFQSGQSAHRLQHCRQHRCKTARVRLPRQRPPGSHRHGAHRSAQRLRGAGRFIIVFPFAQSVRHIRPLSGRGKAYPPDRAPA